MDLLPTASNDAGRPPGADPSTRSSPPDTPAVFAPPAEHWQRLSPRLVTIRRLTMSLTMGVLIAVSAGITAFLGPAAGIPTPTVVPTLIVAVGLALWAFLWVRTRRVVRSWGYAEREGDLCITHGLWFKELIVVPFGRMQVIKVTSGPLTRVFGLASVHLVTASPATGASIPGLPLDEARALRDRIIESSDAKGSGL